MPYRSIDLQVSVQRSPETSTLHNQLLQKTMIEQTKLENEAAKQTELQRTQNAAVEESSHLDIHEHQQREGGSYNPNKRNKKGKRGDESQEASSQPAVHPYKGQHIDISL
ncbi:hypothetical protein [Paenibacillus mendelii]|uniref:RNA polymerase subunit sigma n=1 Tax=Paenibacillus mendelii TaxID=206163 RepID=A0ABV6JGH1_9BACL|nr:hypothetical protein [Paenibacillus mendelii]MCQ6557891.1 hypothetical protein [Paenibacillus mendelii]